jgi:metabolite-proton symporter
MTSRAESAVGGHPTTTGGSTPKMKRRAAFAAFAGTSLEWYDYHVYSTASALIIAKVFFPSFSPLAGTLAAFATFAVGFVARPLGGILAGHFGDRYGRKHILQFTLILMGVSTMTIGMLPTYASIGVAAPIMLVVLRLLQGLSAGGEWGGAALMSVEHAPAHRRGLFGSFTQLGTPAGVILANTVILAVTFSMTDEQFQAWGWRLPFLFSLVIFLVGIYIRTRVEESPAFTQLTDENQPSAPARQPLVTLLRTDGKRVALAIGTFIGSNAVGYLFLAFTLSYGTKQLGMSASTMLLVVLIGCIAWLPTTMGSAWLSDKIGRLTTYRIGYIALIAWAVPYFALLNTRSTALMIVAVVGLMVGLGATYGPQAALFAELFPAAIRYSGASLSSAIGAVLGGGLAPLIATSLFAAAGTTLAVSGYIVSICALSLVATIILGTRSFRRLPADMEDPHAAENRDRIPQTAVAD